ncbi:MAG: hypothetical protein MZV65_37605 [Chromatiales bacterium]|nr:hypothetical protein [Chromatiales bacterium]
MFRITAAQLKARDGQVRCGRCQSVLQGEQHLVERPERKVERPPGAPRKRSGRKTPKTEVADSTTGGPGTHRHGDRRGHRGRAWRPYIGTSPQRRPAATGRAAAPESGAHRRAVSGVSAACCWC